MKERPILFSGEMVRALLAGTKTQTRRVWKLPRGCQWYAELGGESEGWVIDPGQPWWLHVDEFHCPYGRPGDRLWVRESWRTTGDGGRADYLPPRDLQPHPVWYGADGMAPKDECVGKLRPSMFMPRWASRITLEIVGVRVERLQDISEADAIAEGLRQTNRGAWLPGPCDHPEWAYHYLWDQINGAGSWDANPYVWVVEFKRIP